MASPLLFRKKNTITAFKTNLTAQLSLHKRRVSLSCLHTVASLINRLACFAYLKMVAGLWCPVCMVLNPDKLGRN
jgi:hypothetical protein